MRTAGYKRISGPSDSGMVVDQYTSIASGIATVERTRHNIWHRSRYRKSKTTTHYCAVCGFTSTKPKVAEHAQSLCESRPIVSLSEFHRAMRGRASRSRWMASSRVRGWGSHSQGYTAEIHDNGVLVGYGGERNWDDDKARTFLAVHEAAKAKGWAVTKLSDDQLIVTPPKETK